MWQKFVQDAIHNISLLKYSLMFYNRYFFQTLNSRARDVLHRMEADRYNFQYLFSYCPVRHIFHNSRVSRAGMLAQISYTANLRSDHEAVFQLRGCKELLFARPLSNLSQSFFADHLLY